MEARKFPHVTVGDSVIRTFGAPYRVLIYCASQRMPSFQ